MTTHTTDTTTKQAVLSIERVFDATPERLWSFWTDPKKYAKWLNPAPIDLVIHEFDVRPGGKVRFDMPQPDGNRNPQEGVFHVLDPYRRIVTGAPDKSFLITVDFEPVGAKRTRMRITVVGVPQEFHGMATKGWNAGLDKLESELGGRAASGAARKATSRVTADRYVELERFFRAPPERLYAAWTTPAMLERFFWPVGAGKVKEFSLKPGGRLVVAHATQPWTATWTFKELVPNHRIVIVDHWDDGSGHTATGTLDFIPQNGGTLLKVRHGPFPTSGPYQPEAARTGFSMVAERLAEEVETPGQGEGFTLVRHLAAPPARVWQMWTTPAGLAKWWAPSARQMGYDFKVNQFDVRVGGGYDIEMSNAEHGHLHNHGAYTEVVPQKRLSMRWDFDIFLAPGEKPYPISITIDFEEEAGMDPSAPKGTKMTFTQGPMAKPEHTEGSRQGVIQNFGYLAKAVEHA
jgi:uncharacterized protein YndB with AHSA1/START domain